MSTIVQFLVSLDVENANNMGTAHVEAMLRDAIARQYSEIGLTNHDDEALVNGFTVRFHGRYEPVTITTFPSGDVQVIQKAHENSVETRLFRALGNYVHQVFPNGATSQICVGLSPRGPTLMIGEGGELADVIRKTLSLPS